MPRQPILRLGLSDAELRRIIDMAVGSGQENSLGGEEYVDPNTVAVRRLAWEAAAALIAANNRRLMDQLGQPGLLAALTEPARLATPAPRRDDGRQTAH